MNSNQYLLPIAIVIAGIFAGVAILIVRGGYLLPNDVPAPNTDNVPAGKEISLRPVGTRDHILGNPDAAVIIIEYSDFGCPYCALFHATMQDIMSTYGKEGKVAWVLRHFPYEEKHINSTKTAQLSECLAERRGETAFWDFADNIFTASRATPETELFTLQDSIVSNAAISAGLKEGDIPECYTEKSFASRVDSDYKEGLKLAENDSTFGTPYIIIIGRDGTKEILSGVQEYSIIKSYIDLFLKI